MHEHLTFYQTFTAPHRRFAVVSAATSVDSGITGSEFPEPATTLFGQRPSFLNACGGMQERCVHCASDWRCDVPQRRSGQWRRTDPKLAERAALVECILNSFTDYSLLFLLRGRVDPGWICSILTRARSIFVMMPRRWPSK